MSAVKIDGKHVEASGVSFELSNTGKVLFPDDGLTKGELVEYYAQVADAMLPYLKDRPIAMARYPDGITKQRIFQKNPGKYFPDWITSVEVKKEGGTLRHVVCDKAATLLYLANQAVIEFHVFLSRVDSLECADQVVVDFDPPDNDGFDQARQCALWLRSLLEDELGLTSYVKTTGGKGLHVHVPLNRKQGFEETRTFAREASQVLAAPASGRGDGRAARPGPRSPRLRRRHARRLRPDRRGPLHRPRPPRRPRGHPAALGRGRGSGPGPRAFHPPHRPRAPGQHRRSLGGHDPASLRHSRRPRPPSQAHPRLTGHAGVPGHRLPGPAMPPAEAPRLRRRTKPLRPAPTRVTVVRPARADLPGRVKRRKVVAA